MKDDPMRIPTPEERAANSRALGKMHRGNRFRLMFGQPLLLEEPMKTTTDTPETDAKMFKAWKWDTHKMDYVPHGVGVPAEFARKMERDLIEARKTVGDAAELIAEIMRNEVNAEDECEKWLRAFSPEHLFHDQEG